jgi:tetratricopeptide (TPR) repeat protein
VASNFKALYSLVFLALYLPCAAFSLDCAAGFACAQAGPPDGASLNNLGVSLRLASRPADAIVQFSAAIKIAEADGDDRLLATALGGLGTSLVDQGEFARALPVLRRSLALFEKTAGPDSLETGEAANNLAMAYRKDGDLPRAQAQLDRALSLMEHYLDSRSVELEIAFNNMFIVLAEQKKWDQAEPYVLRAFDIAKTIPESAQRADIQENLALLQAHRAQYRDAAQTMEQVIAIEERTLGPENPRVAASLESYAGYLRKLSQKTEAQRAEQRARGIRRAAL